MTHLSAPLFEPAKFLSCTGLPCSFRPCTTGTHDALDTTKSTRRSSKSHQTKDPAPQLPAPRCQRCIPAPPVPDEKHDSVTVLIHTTRKLVLADQPTNRKSCLRNNTTNVSFLSFSFSFSLFVCLFDRNGQHTAFQGGGQRIFFFRNSQIRY
jgi:hypothetical protein